MHFFSWLGFRAILVWHKIDKGSKKKLELQQLLLGAIQRVLPKMLSEEQGPPMQLPGNRELFWGNQCCGEEEEWSLSKIIVGLEYGNVRYVS